MKLFGISLFLMLTSWCLTAENSKGLPELTDPHAVMVDRDEIIIEDFPKIWVYSLRDFKLKHSFGKQGEGPGEFLQRSGYVRLNISVRKDLIFVESRGRLTFFSRRGECMRQLNSAASGYLFKPLDNGKLVAHKNIVSKNTLYKTLNLFNWSDLKLEKQFFRIKHGIQPGKIILVFDKVLRSFADDRYIYVVSGFDFNIEVFDFEGRPVSKISPKDYQPLAISEKDREEAHAYLKTALSSYPLIKDRLRFPEHFLAIRNVVPDDQLLYVTTYHRTPEGLECFVFHRDGNSHQKIFLPVVRDNVLREYPYDIDEGTLYQLVENQSQETWELHIRNINTLKDS